MKIQINSYYYVKNKFGRYYSPEFVYIFPASQSDGWYINDKPADAVESKIVDTTRFEIIYGNKTIESFVDSLITRDFSNAQLLRLEKMTKAQATAIEMWGITYLLQDNQWKMAGIGVDTEVLKLLSMTHFTVSSGIIQPLLNGSAYGATLSKDKKWLVLSEASTNSLFVCGTMNV